MDEQSIHAYKVRQGGVGLSDRVGGRCAEPAHASMRISGARTTIGCRRVTKSSSLILQTKE